jgi:hypothetical protein
MSLEVMEGVIHIIGVEIDEDAAPGDSFPHPFILNRRWHADYSDA